ncbi:hypothetical protein AcV5_003804 [Taiwanofungus camphoratus]|nr:hypothetical protein AcV5_003804 [Antrodia cinnamomea]
MPPPIASSQSPRPARLFPLYLAPPRLASLSRSYQHHSAVSCVPSFLASLMIIMHATSRLPLACKRARFASYLLGRASTAPATAPIGLGVRALHTSHLSY